MRMPSSETGPVWILGIIVALVLIVVAMRGDQQPNQAALETVFGAQPVPAVPDLPDMPSLPDMPTLPDGADLPGLPDLFGSSVAEPDAESARIRVAIRTVQPGEGGVVVIGEVENISSDALIVPVRAFEFTDGIGAVYTSDSDGQVTLEPGERNPLELAVPVEPGTSLRLTTRLPPDPPLVQVLIAPEEP